MRIKLAIFLVFVLTASAFCRKQTILVEYRDGKTETIRKASFADTIFFRINNRVVQVNPRQLYKIEIFADTIDIYFGETWVRADIHPVSKDSVPPVHRGFVKVKTRLTGIADFGALSTSVSELKQINFRPSKPKAAAAENENVATETENPENSADNTDGSPNEQQ